MSFHFSANGALRNSKPDRKPKTSEAVEVKSDSKIIGTLMAGNSAGFMTLDKEKRIAIKENARTGEITSKVSTDSRGNMRLHGAFAGGFSAGYFNTVGSKEGWTPQEFKSTRDKRAGAKVAKPEDFMDWEDREEQAEAGSTIVAKDAYDKFGDEQTNGIVVESEASIGMKLLKLMGWKEGTLIGNEVVTKSVVPDTQTAPAPQKKVYGVTLPAEYVRPKPKEQSILEMGEAAFASYLSRVTGAPAKVPVYEADLTQSGHGIGYNPTEEFRENLPRKELTSSKNRISLSGAPKVSSGMKNMSLSNLDEADETDDVYGFADMNAYDKDLDARNPTVSSAVRESKDIQVTAALFSRFVLGTRHTLPALKYKGPPVPSDFNPMHFFPNDANDLAESVKPKLEQMLAEINKKLASKALPTSFGKTSEVSIPSTSFLPEKKVSYNPPKSAAQRGNLLGETPLPAPPVTSQTSSKDVFLSASLSKQFVLGEMHGPSSTSKPGLSYLTKEESEQLASKNATSSVSLRARFLSQFPSDLAKTARLTAFVDQLSANASAEARSVASGSQIDVPAVSSRSVHSENLTDFQLQQEQREFKELFETSTFGKMLKNEWAMEMEVARESERVRLDRQKQQALMESSGSRDYIKASKLGLFGKLTRHIEDWRPERLLLRRLNIADPFETRQFVPDNTLKLHNGIIPSTFDTRVAAVFQEAGYSAANASSPTANDNSHLPALSAEKLAIIEQEIENSVPEKIERPSMDLFKAIFDDEDDDDIPRRSTAPPVQPVYEPVKPKENIDSTAEKMAVIKPEIQSDLFSIFGKGQVCSVDASSPTESIKSRENSKQVHAETLNFLSNVEKNLSSEIRNKDAVRQVHSPKRETSARFVRSRSPRHEKSRHRSRSREKRRSRSYERRRSRSRERHRSRSRERHRSRSRDRRDDKFRQERYQSRHNQEIEHATSDLKRKADLAESLQLKPTPIEELMAVRPDSDSSSDSSSDSDRKHKKEKKKKDKKERHKSKKDKKEKKHKNR